MIIQIARGFYKKIPKDILPRIKVKIQQFADMLSKDTTTFKNLTKGFFCKKIRSTENYYKFKISRGNRIIFRYLKDVGILLVRFCCHDTQIRAARNRTADDEAWTIQQEDSVEDDFDKQIDTEFLNEIRAKLLDNDLKVAKELLVQESNPKYKKKIKTIDKAISLQKFYDDYKSQGYGKSGLEIYVPSGRITQDDYKYALNRLYEERRIIIAPYCIVHATFMVSLHQAFFFDDAEKHIKPLEYNAAFAAALHNTIGSLDGGRSIILESCFYDKNRQLIDNNLSLRINTRDRTIEELQTSVMNYWEKRDDPMRDKNSFVNFLNMHLNGKSIAQKNLQFLGI